MAKVIYTGPSDIRELAAADLSKVGVEGFTKKSFNRGEAVDVDQNVADALIEHGEIFGDFKVADESEDTELEGLESGADDKGETKSTSDATPRARTAGSSTRTR